MNIEKMTESVLASSVQRSLRGTTLDNNELADKNNQLLEGYDKKPYGDEEEGYSQVVSDDISAGVESDLTSIVRTFTNGGNIIEFVPMSSDPLAVEEAMQKTEYVNYIVRTQKNSFKILHDWFKSALIQRYSVVKYYVDKRTQVKEDKFKNVTKDELVTIEEELQTKNVKSLEIISTSEPDTSIPEEVKAAISNAIQQDFNSLPSEQQDALILESGYQPLEYFDVTFRIIEEVECIKIQCIPTEDFIISEGASSKDDAIVVGDRITKTRGDLLAENYDKELIDSLSTMGNTDISKNSDIEKTRQEISYGKRSTFSENTGDWASQEVEIYDLYVKIDFDGDGIAERRHILMSGNTILENEVFNHVPYAILSSILMPFEVIGKSRAEFIETTQRMKTVVMRGMFDNFNMSNTQRVAANENVNVDDLMDVRPDGIVRVRGNNPINNDLIPISTQFTGDRALMILNSLDNAKSITSGNLQQNQGLLKDSVANETATKTSLMDRAGSAKIELVAKNFAETGIKDLFEGIAYLVKRFQDDEKEILVLKKPMIITPYSWTNDNYLICELLDEEKNLEAMQFIFQLQKDLILNGSVLSDELKVYKTLTKITKGLGLYDTSNYFNDPTKPDEILFAQNAQLQAQVQQLTAQVESMANPLAEAETIKAEASLIQAEAKQQLDIAKLQENQRQFDIKTQNQQKDFEEKMIEKLTELELKYQKDVPGSVV